MRLFAPWLLAVAAIAGAHAAEPRPDANAVTLPTFIFESRPAITAGVAFLIEENGHRYLITAYHVLGPPGGLKSKILPREVPREVKGIAGLCLGDLRTLVLGTPVLLTEEARPFDANGAEHDVVFSEVKDNAGPMPLKLSKTPAKQGDRVWLFARLADRDRPGLYAGTVTEVNERTLQYALDDPTLSLQGLSGAPVLSSDGTLIAMHLGYGQKDDALVGGAIPATAILERLTAAIAPRAPAEK